MFGPRLVVAKGLEGRAGSTCFCMLARTACNADHEQGMPQLFVAPADCLQLQLSSERASRPRQHVDRSLLESDNILHPLDPTSEPRPVRSLVQLLLQSSVVIRLASWAHERLGERVALAKSIVEKQVCCVDLARFVSLASRCCLNALLKNALEVSLCRAQLVGRPACEEARVVLGDLLRGVSRWDGMAD